MDSFVSDMLFWWGIMLLAILISSFYNGFITPKILLISFRKRLFDEPDKRKIHHDPIPRLGGFAFAPCIIFTVSFAVGVALVFSKGELITHLVAESRSMAFALCALTLIFLIGTMDDLVGVRYRNKFYIQICCAVLLIGGDMWLNDLHGLFGIHEISWWIGYPLTILVVVFIINAVNLMDGIDGLASGLSGVALIYYGAIFMFEEKYAQALISFSALGTIIPFYYYNVFGSAEHGRKIFMGDTGSLTLGLILSFLSIELCSHTPNEKLMLYNYFVLAFVPLVVPCFDVVRVFFHRIRLGRSPFLPDKNHLHHKLLSMGMKQRRAMASILCIAAFLIVINMILSCFIQVTLLIVINMAAWLLFIKFLNKKIDNRDARKDSCVEN